METRSSHIHWGVAIALSTLLGATMVASGCGGGSSAQSPTDGGGPDGTVLVDGSSGASSGSGSSSGGSNGAGFVGDGSLLPEVFTGFGDGGVATTCLKFGAACTMNGDCCGGVCSSGSCAYPACTSDGVACTVNGDCCSQSCVSGTCAALNATCKTLGNGCTSAAQCCSALCSGGTCQASSFCGQAGDACSAGADCCTGVCTIAAGSTLGVCASSPPGGPANCGLSDGMLCSGTGADGGVVYKDGGLPSCGGGCCSRACAPFGPTGVLVCQPASGCHPVGDLCTKDTDCCGSSAYPGGSGMAVTCVITAPNTVGVCRNPMGCKPDGDVCKLKTMSCNASCDCCAGNCETMDTCRQDNVGVPRCAPGTCVAPGGACASSASCCSQFDGGGGANCVPNPADGGTPAYVCSGTACQPACSACTNNADCCPGTSCIVAPGSAHGICGPCGGSSSSSGGGSSSGSGSSSSGGSSSSSSGGTTDSGTTCALYGQICTTAADCCDNIPCSGGHCVIF